MIALQRVLFVFCLICSEWIPFTVTQTGSSFFYYYSPNQPMQVNSQTFGQNAQAYHHSSKDPYSFSQNFVKNQPQPSSEYNQQSNLNPYPTQSPFIPQRNPYSQSSLLDKITFTNGPAISPPTHASLPQFQYNYNTPPPSLPSPTTFSGQSQPSPKLFNFLNQPFQFFQNNFARFPQGESQQNFNAPQPPQEYVTAPPIQEEEEQSRQNFYTYYDRGTTPSRFTLPSVESTKSTPLTFSVNQYFTAKTTKGPASYTFTIESNPTVGPTATVHVNVGSDALPATFPTLSPHLFIPRRNKTMLEDEKVKEVQEEQELISTTTTSTTEPPEVKEVSTEVQLSPSTELVPPPLSSIASTTIPITTPIMEVSSSTTEITTTTTTQPINLEQETNDENNNRKPVKRVILRKKGRGPKIIQDKSSESNPQKNELEVNSQTVPETIIQDISSTTQTPLSSTTRRHKRPHRFRSTTTTTSSTTTIPTPTTITTTTTTEAPVIEEIEPVTTQKIPQENVQTTEKSRVDLLTPTTFRYNTNDFYELITTSEAPFVDTIPSTESIPFSTEKLSSSTQIPIENFEYNDEYEYAYSGEEKVEEISSTVSTTTSTELSSTETLISSTTPETSSTTTTEPDLQSTTENSLILEEEIIEPLSTTEPIPFKSTTESTTTEISNTDNEKEESTTEKSVNAATTENILVTTYRQPIFTEAEVSQAPKTDDARKEEVGGGVVTDPSQSILLGNETLPFSNSTSVSISVSRDESNYDFLEDNYPQEEYIANDPEEDGRIQEAQREALQNALKNIRSRQQNISTTEKPSEDTDLQKKFIRRPTKVNTFPSSTSTSISFSIDEDEELGPNSRTNVIRKIQTFRKKFRKVMSQVKSSSTTKRPRRVTRPSLDASKSSTVETIGTEEETETKPKVNSIEEVPKRPKLITTTTATSVEPETSSIEPEQPQPTTKVLGSLIITEILPSSTTEAMKELVDFDIESEEKVEKSLPTEKTRPSTDFPSLSSESTPFANITQTESIVETATSRTVKERKVKVILKRKKGVPKGDASGTVARQVIKTRRRSSTTPASNVTPLEV